MIDNLHPYPEYKPSGVDWLGDIPCHWQVVLNQRIFRETTRPYLGGDEIQLSLSQRDGLIPTTRMQERSLQTASHNNWKVVFPGDLVLNRFKAHLGVFFAATLRGIVTFHYGVFRSKVAVEPRYFEHLFHTPAYRAIFGGRSNGMTVGLQNLSNQNFYSVRTIVPSHGEQAAIVRFLDHVDQKVRRFIKNKRRLVELLEEQKRLIVEKLVTRGLDSLAQLKPSGVNWLGDVPSHWTVASLRFRYDQCLGKMVDAKKATGRYLVPYLRNIDVRWDSINTEDLPLIDIMPHELERFTVRVGDLLVCEGRHLGRCAFWDGQIELCGFQKALHRLRPLNPATDNPRFLFYCLYLAHIKDAFDATPIDNSIPHLTGEMLRAHKFPFPPLEEQTAIAAYLDDRFAVIKKAMTTVQSEISLVLEFRTRLITDVVTGKLDVREASERLPSLTEPGVPDDDLFDLSALDSEEAESLEDDASELLPVAADED